jgi:hypothetical protein
MDEDKEKDGAAMRAWVISIETAGNVWFQLCKCLSAPATAEVIQSLCEHSDSQLPPLRVDVVEVPEPGPLLPGQTVPTI